jgi:hypothetical protein
MNQSVLLALPTGADCAALKHIARTASLTMS